MASNPIQTKDIIQDNLLKSTIEDFKKWGEIVKSVENDLVDLAKLTKQDLLKIDTKNIESLNNLNDSLKDITKGVSVLNKAKQEEIKISKDLEKLRQAETKTLVDNQKLLQAEEKTKESINKTRLSENRLLIQEQKERERLEKQQQKQLKSLKDEEDAYKRLSKQRTQAQNEYKRLAVELGEGSDEAQKALSRFNELDETFTSVNKAVKDGRPFVGRYADAIKEAGLDASNTTKILIDLNKEKEELTKTLIKSRKQFGNNSKEVKQYEKQLEKLNETIEEVEKSSKSTERAIDKLTDAVKTLAAATLLLKGLEFITGIFKSSDSGADGLAKTIGRLTISVQVFVDRTVKGFEAFKNNFFSIINTVKLTFFEFIDSLNSTPITIFGKKLFDGQVADVTDSIIKLRKEQKELSKSNTDLSSTYDGLTEEINKKVKANDKAIDQERTNIKQIAILNRQSAELTKNIEELALTYDDDSQALSLRSEKIKEAIEIQKNLNETTLNAAKLEEEAARLRAAASTNDSQAQADYQDAIARRIEVETQGLTELNGILRENNSINRDIRDLELDILIDNTDNRKTINERQIADETIAQKQREELLKENVRIIEESFSKQSDAINKEQADLKRPLLDFNKLLELSSEKLAKYLTDNAGETQAIRVLEILKERRTALQDNLEISQEIKESDNQILKLNEDIALQQEALRQINEDGADAQEVLGELEEKRAENNIENLKKEIKLLEKKNKGEGGDSLELLEKRKELNDILLKQEDKQAKEEEKLEEERKEKFKQTQDELLNLLDNALDARYDRIQANLDKELNASKKQQERLQDLADKGSADALESLQDEREKEQEIEREKLRKEREQANLQKGIEIFKVLGSNDGDVAKTIADVTLLETFIQSLPAFKTGTENTGSNGKGVDGQGGMLSILHPNEGVLNAEDNTKKLKAGLTNSQAIDYAISYKNLEPRLKDKAETSRASEYLELKKSIDNLPKNMPLQDLFFDEQEKAYTHIIKRNGITKRVHKKSNGLFR